jgi:UDP:flavonoid glycosyltransferase YjiC (YdhE family)
MRFLLNPIGSIGDVHPYLGIGAALLKRGHEVTVIANPYYEKLIRKVGLDHAPLGTVEDLEGFWRDPKMWQPWHAWKVSLDWSVIRPMRPAYEIIASRYVPGRTVVAGPGWAFGARIAQERLGVPMASLHLGADKFQSIHESPRMPPPMWLPDRMPRVLKAMQYWIADAAFTDPLLAPATNAFRKELGLPPVRRLVGRWWHSPQRVIGMFPDWFCPPQPDWPAQTLVTGFPLWDQSEVVDIPRDLSEFVESGDPPVVFTFGTANKHTRRFFHESAEACRRSGRRGILITRFADDLPASLPDGVRHFPYVPFGYLLPRAAAMVHHAGTGTTAQGLANGLPQIVVPMAFGQPQNAFRLDRLGVGRSLSIRGFRATAVSRWLDRFLDSPQVTARCRELARRFENRQPIEETCDLLEQLAGTDGHLQPVEHAVPHHGRRIHV